MPEDFMVVDEWVEAQQKKQKKKFQIIWGGADVDPSIYNRPVSNKCGWTDIKRDRQELELIHQCMEDGIPIIGICRGSQLLNVANGGILVQHIEGHTKRHTVKVATQYQYTKASEQEMLVTSTHHQMSIPTKDGIIIAKDHNPTKGVHWDNVNETVEYPYVNEVIWYPNTKSLCIQPHPEWMDQESAFVNWINALLIVYYGFTVDFKFEEVLNGDF